MAAPTTITALDSTHADCLRTVSDIGSSTVMNICDGTAHVVPWGSADWLGVGALALVVVVAASMAGALTVMVWRMVTEGF